MYTRDVHVSEIASLLRRKSEADVQREATVRESTPINIENKPGLPSTPSLFPSQSEANFISPPGFQITPCIFTTISFIWFLLLQPKVLIKVRAHVRCLVNSYTLIEYIPDFSLQTSI